MKKLLCRFSQFALFAALSFVALSSCESSKDDSGRPPVNPEYHPVVNDPVVYKNSVLLYYGVDNEELPSSWYKLSLYTDMELDQMGNPIGPGQLLRLSINAPLFDEAATEYPLPEGTYRAMGPQGEFEPFTFVGGFMSELNLPTGLVEIPEGTFFGDVPEGVAEYTPDMLDTGSFSVSKSADGVYTITGTLIGTSNMKRKFVYTGKLEVIDNQNKKVPNSSLTKDLTINDFAKARIYDKGDSFWLGDESSRTLELRLSDSGIGLMEDFFPTGTGRMLRIEFFVPWDAKPTDGVPAGEYKMAPLINEGGLSRTDVIPFHIYPGVPPRDFATPSGTWYQEFKDKKLINYGMLQTGKMIVERDGNAHTFKIEFVDCNAETPHKVTCTYSTPDLLPIFTD